MPKRTTGLSISIVVCTYNNVASLRRTLASIDNIRFPPDVRCELCLVNNNSSDDTQITCENYAGRSPIPARHIFEGKQGLSNARNRGIAEAVGDFIIFTDDDVVVPPDWIANYATAIRKFDADAVFGRIVPEWDGLAPRFFRPDLNAAYALLDYGDQGFVVTDRSHEFFGANFGCSRELLKAAGGFDAKLGRTKGFLFVGEERQVFLSLMDRQATIAYDPTISVLHVIAEKRKHKPYRRKYYADIANSLVYMADLRANRAFFGVPLYKAKECLVFFLKLVPRALVLLLSGTFAKLFVLELQTPTFSKMLAVYFKRSLKRIGSPSTQTTLQG